MRATFLTMGDAAPEFTGRTRFNEHFIFDTVAGRYVILTFFGSSADPRAAALLRAIRDDGGRFDDVRFAFFGVTIDPEDEEREATQDRFPGIRFFFDTDRAISAAYGTLRDGAVAPVTYIIDPALRVIGAMPVNGDPAEHVRRLTYILDRLPPLPEPFRALPQAPVLVLPRIFEPRLCRALIDHYEAGNKEDSGFMRDMNGKTVKVINYGHKRRTDVTISDAELREACMSRIYDRLVPQIYKAFQFQATRMERYLIACYDAGIGGYFRPHRDNTTKGTAHRRFAVSLFLNAGEYEGGQLRFPEFGPALYAAPTGGAVVFSCSLLHEAMPVTRGRRYMFLPFLYDEAARKVREENLPYVDLTE